MNSLLAGLIVGSVAAVLDALPMALRRMSVANVASAAVQWIVVGLVVAHLETGLPSWANGLAAGFLCALPIAILVSGSELKSVPVILAASAVLGTLCGIGVKLLA
jgi:hypothetical protein